MGTQHRLRARHAHQDPQAQSVTSALEGNELKALLMMLQLLTPYLAS